MEATVRVLELAHKKDKSVINNDFNIGKSGHTSIEELGEKIWEKFRDDRPFKFVSLEKLLNRGIAVSMAQASLNAS